MKPLCREQIFSIKRIVQVKDAEPTDFLHGVGDELADDRVIVSGRLLGRAPSLFTSDNDQPARSERFQLIRRDRAGDLLDLVDDIIDGLAH